jgi:hypothetical protein
MIVVCRFNSFVCQDKFFVNNPIDVKENDKHTLDSGLHFPLGGLMLCLRVITVSPALVTSDNTVQEGCIIGGDLTKLLADVFILLLLISCQKLHQARYTTSNKKNVKNHHVQPDE